MSNNYILTSDGNFMGEDELYHWLKKGEEAEDHKYVKREWTGKRWKYWYKNSERKRQDFIYDKVASVNKTRNTSSLYKKTGKTMYDIAKENQAKKDAAAKTNAAKKQNSLADKLKSALDTIGDKIVDSVGITDRRESKAAEKEAHAYKSRVDAAQRTYDNARDKAYEDNDITERERRSIVSYKKSLDDIAKKYSEAGEKYSKEHAEYLKTPLGAVENAVQKGAEFFKNLFGGNSGESEYDKLKKEALKNQKEAERQKKGEYVEAQTQERNTVRMPELRKLLKVLNMPDTLFKKNNPLPDLSLKTKATTLDEDMALVNPKYESNKELYDENCAKCSLTYDLRRRGYDVTAASEKNTDGSVGLRMSDIAACYKGADIQYVSDIKEKYNVSGDVYGLTKYLERELTSYGEGARGNLALAWTSGGGHSIVWEVENGRAVFRDCQTNQKIDIDDYMSYSNNFNWIRTDNLVPTEEIMKYVRNR